MKEKIDQFDRKLGGFLRKYPALELPLFPILMAEYILAPFIFSKKYLNEQRKLAQEEQRRLEEEYNRKRKRIEEGQKASSLSLEETLYIVRKVNNWIVDRKPNFPESDYAVSYWFSNINGSLKDINARLYVHEHSSQVIASLSLRNQLVANYTHNFFYDLYKNLINKENRKRYLEVKEAIEQSRNAKQLAVREARNILSLLENPSNK